MDGSPDFLKRDVTFYHELIGVLRWATELGRADTLLEESVLSQYYQASPGEGHLNSLLHIFGHLKKHTKLSILLDLLLPILIIVTSRLIPKIL